MTTGENKFPPRPIETVKVQSQPTNLESLANARAETDPLPGPLMNAFTPGAIKVADRYVRKFVAYDHVILKALDSPLRRMILELAKPTEMQEEVKSTEQEEWDLCWQFTHDSRQCRDLLAQGVEAFHKTSEDEVAHSWEPETVQFVLAAVFTQLRKNIETANRYAGEAKEANEITFFDGTTG